jgi:hypothetical protein
MHYVAKVPEESPLEIPRSPVVGTKLCLEGFPGDEARLPQVAHSVGEPRVDVEGERRALERLEGPEVDGHGVSNEFVTEL